jgi:hypothetical protein
LETFKQRDKTKMELLVDLSNSGFDATSQWFLKNDLVEICGSRDVPTASEKKIASLDGFISSRECFRCYGKEDG